MEVRWGWDRTLGHWWRDADTGGEFVDGSLNANILSTALSKYNKQSKKG